MSPAATPTTVPAITGPARGGRGRTGVRAIGATLALAGAATLGQFAMAPAAMAAWGPVQATGDVNVRQAPSTGSQVLGVLDAGDTVTQAAAPTHGYVPVTWHGQRAYVWAAYLSGETTGEDPTPAPTPTTSTTTLWTTSAVNVRAGASSHAAIITQLAADAQVQATGTVHGSWTQIKFSGDLRWVFSSYLTSTDPTSTTVVDPTPTTPVSDPTTSTKAAAAVAFARAQLGEPYVYGATGPGSWDCSGLTQAAWAAAGVSIPRVSYDQLSQLTHVDKDDLQPGDIVGFYSGGHVGIYIGDGMVIHAPHTGDVVRIAALSSMPYYTAVRP